jgi:hypothetical protein
LVRSNHREFNSRDFPVVENLWGVSGLALDDLDERFATAVKLALGASRTAGNAESDAGLECPPTDMIASYYEYTLNRAERARLEEHFSGCARCQGTLAALLRTAPANDSVSEAAGSAASAARRPAAQSAGIRERWFESRPAWRIAGLTAVAAAMLAIVVVAGLHLYESRIGQESEQVAALSPTPGRDHRQRSHPAPTASSPNASSGAELALNDKKSAYKSLMPPVPAEPTTATAPSAAAAAPGAPSTPPANAPAETGAPAEEVAPPIAPSSAEQNGAVPASAAQAAAALGALAATPAPATTTAPAMSAAPSVAAAPSAAAPSVPAPAAGAVAAGAIGAGIAAKAAPPPNSQTTARAAPPAAPGAVNETQRQLEKVSPTTPSLQQPEHPAVTQAPANASKVAPAENSRQSASVAEPAPTADVAALARKRAQQQLAKEQLAQQQLAQQKFAQQQLEQDRLAEAEREAEMTRKAELARKAELERKAELARKAELERKAELDRRAELARKAEQAKRNADLKRKLELANREAQARQARPASSITPRNESASTQMQIASAPPQSQRGVGSAGAAIGGSSAVGQAQTGAPIAASPGTGAAATRAPASGNVIARAEPPIYSAPVVAKIAPGIPVAPHAILITPPDHSVYWSLQNSGLIYRTSDRKSWTPESTGVQAEFLAGMAPSNTICWAVGRKGVILLTTDGTHWERINSPTASDVIGIVAASKDVATIFTAGGVNYSTFDGGSNWEQAN